MNSTRFSHFDVVSMFLYGHKLKFKNIPIAVTSQFVPPNAYPKNPPKPAIIVKVLRPLAWSSKIIN